MIYLAVKSDSKICEIYLIKDGEIIDKNIWESGMSLAKNISSKITNILENNSVSKVNGYIGYLGPGSFTGLRIGLTSLNALAYINNVSIVGVSGSNWIDSGIVRLNKGEDDKVLTPEYGGEANITPQKR